MAALTAFIIRLNWIDILAFIIFIRVLIISLKCGAPNEAFKLVGALAASYAGLHYYRSLSAYLASQYTLDAETLSGTIFAVLACLAYGFFSLLRLLLTKYINMEVVPVISRWLGLCLGVFRAFLLASLLFYFFLATDNPYLRKSVKTSFSGPGLVYMAPSTYGFLWNTLMSKLMPKEKFNSVVFEIDRDHTKKKK